MMGGGVDAVADWWTVGPSGQVTFLAAVDPELLSVALDPLPTAAPAVVQFRPDAACAFNDLVVALLADLDRVAIDLFPAWLPGAERLDGSHGLGATAVRALAEERAAKSENFGPFLADLAERSLRRQPGDRSSFPAAIRAAGLARVIADSYGRGSAALLVTVPGGLRAHEERSLVAAAEWLAQYGRLAVWLAGAALRIVDRVQVATVVLPESVSTLAGETVQADTVDGVVAAMLGSALRYAPLAGRPRDDSPAEQKLERALAAHDWAQGREWNRTYEWHLLAKPYRLDLFWPSDGVIVEVDGPEHRGQVKYADDRRRDVQLQLLGHDVLRFTNEQVLSDVRAVTIRIEQLLRMRRAAGRHRTEEKQHVRD